MKSKRLGLQVVLTHHARHRMAQRLVSVEELVALIEEGDLRFKDASRLWISIHFDHRDDNLVCVAAVMERCLIIKTVMTLWEPLR